MKPIDFRNETFAGLRERLVALRERVWLAWSAYETAHPAAEETGATTREVAAFAQMDILCLRPRATELYQMGLLALVESQPGSEGPSAKEGRYRLRSIPEWELWHAEQRAAVTSAQQQLPLTA